MATTGTPTARNGDPPAIGRRKRPTQADVARRAGVSVSIVSAVINDRQYGNIRISQATRQRVLDVVRDVGYAPNLAARGLAGGSNHLLGVFTFQRLFPVTTEDFFNEFLIGIEEQSEESGYNLLLLTAAKDPSGRRSLFPQGTNGMQLADGGVLIGWDERVDEVRRLADEGFPFVYLGQQDIPGLELSYVAADYVGATSELTSKLLDSHWRPAFIDNSEHTESVPGRRAGFRAAFEKSDTDLDPVELGLPSDVSDEAYATLISEVKASGINCVLVENSRHAAGLDRVARTTSCELEVLNLGGAPVKESTSALNGLVVPRREMGREAVRLLQRLLSEPGAAPVRSILPCQVKLPR